MRSRAALLATDALAEQAGAAHLAAGGTAIEAVIAGFLAMAGAHPGVLLGPVSLLAGGVGHGGRAFDGRVRQPGTGTRRPRGFRENEPVPPAARVGAPTALHAVLIGHAYAGGGSLRALMAPGISAAKEAKARERARLLERVARVGAAALAEASFQRPLLQAAGPSEGGLLTPRDLGPPSAVDHGAHEIVRDERAWLVPPWGGERVPADAALGRGAGLCAVDARGAFAALAFRVFGEGLFLESLELIAPLLAVPVSRGVPRVAPGRALPCPAPLAIRVDAQGRLVDVALTPEAWEIDLDASVTPRLAIHRDATTRVTSITRA